MGNSSPEYKSFFLPAPVGGSQPWVGDVMPYFEDGVFYIYYLKDGGDSYNHSIFLATSKDLADFTEHPGPILEAAPGRDFWMGTGSVVKVGEKYYLFYTAHNASPKFEFDEVIRVAEGTSPTSFKKREDWMLTPPAFLGQRIDFRDPQGYYDPASDTIALTVTASHQNTAKALKFTVSGDLKTTACDGFIFTNDKERCGDFWNLECTDTFRLGDTYYLTYSAQNDTLWYAMSSRPYGPYGVPRRLDGKLFYSAKHVESPDGAWMVGWARRSADSWGGNLMARKLCRKENGELYLMPVDAVLERFQTPMPLSCGENVTVRGGSARAYVPALACHGSFMINGKFRFDGRGSFGLAFDATGEPEESAHLSVDPAAGRIRLTRGRKTVAEVAAALESGREYDFSYIQEGTLGLFTVNAAASLTVRVPSAESLTLRLFARAGTAVFSNLHALTPSKSATL